MELKSKAREMRLAGKTYSEISKELKTAKSTLFYWLSDIRTTTSTFDKNEHLSRIRVLAIKALSSKRLERSSRITEKISKEVNHEHSENRFYVRSIAAMLYWSEGSKGRNGMSFANTDPLLSLLFLTSLRKGFDIKEEKLRVRLHLHSYHNVDEKKLYWSNLLNVPLSQFGKIYIKPRSKTRKFRQNFAGICFIRYYSEELRIELLTLGKGIASKYVPVAQLD